MYISSVLVSRLIKTDMLKLNAVRLGLGRPLQQPPSPSSFFISAPSASASALRFTSGGSGEEEMDDSNKHNNDPKSKTVDTMAASFGAGYATRSDDDGFGGVYGGNESVSKGDEDRNVHEIDHNQGSEVKEKEKARNQEKLADV